MKLEAVAKLSAEDRFWYWIKERHSIYLKKENGDPKPWTDDEVLQSYFFTNPYRENDKVTKWYRKYVRVPLNHKPEVIFATIAFRWFNLPSTGAILLQPNLKKSLLVRWDEDRALRLLRMVRAEEHPVFTGAFMINSPPGKPKLEAICERVSNVWRDVEDLKTRAGSWTSLQEAHKDLTRYPGLGGFMAYEVVCDLRFTHVLSEATDIKTWANPGPGCTRGLYRIAEIEIKNKSNATSPPKLPDTQLRLRRLLTASRKRLHGLPRFEMREIEHSLCEFDKYERLRVGDGRAKRRYPGVSNG